MQAYTNLEYVLFFLLVICLIVIFRQRKRSEIDHDKGSFIKCYLDKSGKLQPVYYL